METWTFYRVFLVDRTFMWSSESSSANMRESSFICAGKVYRLRRPSRKHLNSVGLYDSSNPTKDWGFPVLGLSLLNNQEDHSVENETAVNDQTERRTESLVSKPFVPNTGHWKFKGLASAKTKVSWMASIALQKVITVALFWITISCIHMLTHVDIVCIFSQLLFGSDLDTSLLSNLVFLFSWCCWIAERKRNACCTFSDEVPLPWRKFTQRTGEKHLTGLILHWWSRMNNFFWKF